MIQVDRLAADAEGEWDEFLRGRPDALFVHSIAYRKLLVAALGCEAEYLVARDGGEIRGVLPIMWSGDAGGRICNSLPYYGSPGGPLGADPDADRALIDAWDERASDPGTLAATMIENPFTARSLQEPLHQLTDERISQFTILPPGGGEAEVTALISSEARGNVRRAERRGVSVERDNDALDQVRRIHEEVMEGHSTPPKSGSFFDAIPSQLRAGQDFDIWLARVEGEVAAALLVIRFNGVSEYFMSGTKAGFRSHDPHPALVFAALIDETRKGARIWNWGGTRLGMDGVFHFKGKWGSQERRYRYLVQVNDDTLRDASPDELVSRFPGFYVIPFAALRSRAA
jgi:GNAT acetyltransferase-like protein